MESANITRRNAEPVVGASVERECELLKVVRRSPGRLDGPSRYVSPLHIRGHANTYLMPRYSLMDRLGDLDFVFFLTSAAYVVKLNVLDQEARPTIAQTS